MISDCGHPKGFDVPCCPSCLCKTIFRLSKGSFPRLPRGGSKHQNWARAMTGLNILGQKRPGEVDALLALYRMPTAPSKKSVSAMDLVRKATSAGNALLVLKNTEERRKSIKEAWSSLQDFCRNESNPTDARRGNLARLPV